MRQSPPLPDITFAHSNWNSFALLTGKWKAFGRFDAQARRWEVTLQVFHPQAGFLPAGGAVHHVSRSDAEQWAIEELRRRSRS